MLSILFASLHLQAAPPLETCWQKSSCEAERQFLTALQSANAEGCPALADLAELPLYVHRGEAARTLESRADILAQCDDIFTPEVREAIRAARYEDLFINWQGAAIANGILWFRELCLDEGCDKREPMLIATINVPVQGKLE